MWWHPSGTLLPQTVISVPPQSVLNRRHCTPTPLPGYNSQQVATSTRLDVARGRAGERGNRLRTYRRGAAEGTRPKDYEQLAK